MVAGIGLEDMTIGKAAGAIMLMHYIIAGQNKLFRVKPPCRASSWFDVNYSAPFNKTSLNMIHWFVVHCFKYTTSVKVSLILWVLFT